MKTYSILVVLSVLTVSCSGDETTGEGSGGVTNNSAPDPTGLMMPTGVASPPSTPMSQPVASTPMPQPVASTPASPEPLAPVTPSTPAPALTPTSGEGGAGGADDVNAGGMGGDMSVEGMGGASPDPGSAGAGGGESTPDGTGGMSADGSGGGGGEPEPNGMVNPSPGCGMGGRPAGGKVYNAGDSWISFPESYDGNTPFKVLWAWHGCGAENFGDANRTEYWDKTRGTVFEDEYVIAIPLAASGSCFAYNTDIVRTKALYDELVQNYCVDLDHMFGTGHSSGANFLHQMLQGNHSADWEYLGLRGIAPVASGPVNNQTTQVPVMYIHSPGESVDPNGPAGNFREANGCDMSSQPYETTACNSIHDGDPVTSNCISYDGCDVETIFCPHDDSNYGGTFHGIPCFFYQDAHTWFMTL